MKLLDLLVKELPQRGGWPKTISEVHGLMNWMAGNGIGFQFVEGRAWFYGENFEEVTKDRYDDAVNLNWQNSLKPSRMIMNESFEQVCRPVIEWINNNGNPHNIIQIDATSAVLYSGEKSIHTEEFIKD